MSPAPHATLNSRIRFAATWIQTTLSAIIAKMGYEIRQLPAFFILQTYSRDFQKHLLRNPGPAPLCRFMVHDDDVLDYVDRGELLRKFHDFEVRNFTVEFTSLFLLRTFGPFFRGRCSVRTSSLRRCLKIPPRTTSAAAL